MKIALMMALFASSTVFASLNSVYLQYGSASLGENALLYEIVLPSDEEVDMECYVRTTKEKETLNDSTINIGKYEGVYTLEVTDASGPDYVMSQGSMLTSNFNELGLMLISNLNNEVFQMQALMIGSKQKMNMFSEMKRDEPIDYSKAIPVYVNSNFETHFEEASVRIECL